jgi:ammonium transporter, Amt family
MKRLFPLLILCLSLWGWCSPGFAQNSVAEPLAAAAAAASAAVVEAAAPASAPVFNKGDTAWLTVSTLLVILMTVPGLALFYGGLVRSKNMLSVLMQIMVTFSMVVVLWFIYGYSLAFTEGNTFIGGLDRLFMKGLFDPMTGSFSPAATFSKGVQIPEMLFAAFQATFAGICRAHQVLCGAAVYGAVVHFQLRTHCPHGVVLDGA